MGFRIAEQIGIMHNATKTQMEIIGLAHSLILVQPNISQRIIAVATTQVDAEIATVIVIGGVVIAATITTRVSTSQCIANAQPNVLPVMECITLDLVA